MREDLSGTRRERRSFDKSASSLPKSSIRYHSPFFPYRRSRSLKRRQHRGPSPERPLLLGGYRPKWSSRTQRTNRTAEFSPTLNTSSVPTGFSTTVSPVPPPRSCSSSFLFRLLLLCLSHGPRSRGNPHPGYPPYSAAAGPLLLGHRPFLPPRGIPHLPPLPPRSSHPRISAATPRSSSLIPRAAPRPAPTAGPPRASHHEAAPPALMPADGPLHPPLPGRPRSPRRI